MARSARTAAYGVLLFLVFTPAARSDDESTALLERFRKEGPIGWARLEERDNELTYKMYLTNTNSGQFRNDQSKVSFNWSRRSGCLRLEKVELDGRNEGWTTVLVHTDKHKFHLRRSKGEKAWELVSAEEVKDKSDIHLLLGPSIGIYFLQPTTTFTGGTSYRFLDFKNDPTIKFQNARWDGDGIRIDFNAVGRTHVTNKPFETRGSIVFDPSNHWAMLSSELHRPSDGLQVKVVNSFGKPDRFGIRPIVARREEAIGQTGSLVQEFRYEAVETGPAPPERFRLADFGLSESKSDPSLKVGDIAPELRATRWFQGEKVSKFEPGKVYVVEFWATWCGPCLAYMPHLAELHARYKDQGVTIVGFTAADPNNTEEKVASFVQKRGPDLKYAFAFANDKTTIDAWMKAAGRSGIPCSFLVDKTGRIAYIGHPMYLDLALSRVVAGTATARAVGDEMSKVESELNAILTNDNIIRDPKSAYQAIKSFESKYPPLADSYPAARMKLSFLPKYGNPVEAKSYAEALVARASKKRNTLILSLVTGVLRQGDGKECPELLAVAVAAAEAIVRIDGGKDARTLIDLADAYFVSGDNAKAKEYAAKAFNAVTGEPSALKEFIEKEVRRLGTEK